MICDSIDFVLPKDETGWKALDLFEVGLIGNRSWVFSRGGDGRVVFKSLPKCDLTSYIEAGKRIPRGLVESFIQHCEDGNREHVGV